MSQHEFRLKLQAIPSAAGRLWAIVTYFRSLTDEAIDAMGGNAAVATYAATLYDTYVKPYDISFIPNMVEPYVDEAVKALVVKLIFAVDDDAKPAS